MAEKREHRWDLKQLKRLALAAAQHNIVVSNIEFQIDAPVFPPATASIRPWEGLPWPKHLYRRSDYARALAETGNLWLRPVLHYASLEARSLKDGRPDESEAKMRQSLDQTVTEGSDPRTVFHGAPVIHDCCETEYSNMQPHAWALCCSTGYIDDVTFGHECIAIDDVAAFLEELDTVVRSRFQEEGWSVQSSYAGEVHYTRVWPVRWTRNPAFTGAFLKRWDYRVQAEFRPVWYVTEPATKDSTIKIDHSDLGRFCRLVDTGPVPTTIREFQVFNESPRSIIVDYEIR